jgi:hypothetical protein
MILATILYLKITFGVLPFLGRALRNYKNTLVRYLSHGHPLKHPTGFYFYNIRVTDVIFKITHFFYIRVFELE